MRNLEYVFTDSGVTVVSGNGDVVTLDKTSPLYVGVVEALQKRDFVAVKLALNLDVSFEAYVKGKASINILGLVTYNGKQLKNKLSEAITNMHSRGEDARPMIRFLEKAFKGSTQDEVDSIFDFVEKNGLHITEDGNILAYKYVTKREDGSLTDSQTKTFDYSVGNRPEMPREQVCADRNQACGPGLHVGTWEYVHTNGHILAVEVDPADVVSVPLDHSCQKMRCCRFHIILENQNEKYSDTTYTVKENEIVPIKLTTPGGHNYFVAGLLDNPTSEHWSR